MKRLTLGVIVIFFILSIGCEKDRGFNIFSKEKDVELGMQMKEEIEASPDFIVADPVEYKDAYDHLNRIMRTILYSASDIKNGDDVFNWEAYIILNDDVLNAFACPGGYMYFYTGLIKFLKDESQFAGVMAHEMAHVELRHSTRQLTERYSFSILTDVLLGKAENYADSIFRGLTGTLTFLAFSRDYEYQADEYAVKFLSDTDYDPLGVAGFFNLLEEELVTGHTPAFLSTHPSPDKRIENIESVWESEGSLIGEKYVTRYNEFKQSLQP